jgi:flagellar biosynthesis protein FlhA
VVSLRLPFSMDLLLGAAVILMVLMMVVPLPPGLLSLLIACNLAISLSVVLLATYTQQPLDFSALPSLLVLTTLFRLALNVSTARLILLRANAGAVVQAFGQFVVGGNPLVGFIVFLILVIIQFVVITRGAERVAEVAARFTLDAMPGKQMAIDADLNAGIINDKVARQRREAIEREADFYGAMDGASKFVKGDAIAALLIIGINIVGGLLVGLLQRHMTLGAAVQRYTLLTVGDGLTAQIPALLISTATGIVVTRAAEQENLGRELGLEFLAQPRVLLSAAVAMLLLAFVPGLPKLPFLVIALIVGFIWWRARPDGKAAAAPRRGVAAEAPEVPQPGTTPAATMPLLEVDPLEIEIGYGLLRLAEGPGGGELMARVAASRRQLALDLGLVLPLVRVRDNLQLPPNAYVFKLRGTEVARGELHLDGFLALETDVGEERVQGLPTREPAFGLPALWIAAADKMRAELAGYTVVDPPTVLATHFTEVCRRVAPELLTRQECRALLDAVRVRQPALVEELVPALLSVGQVQRVLQNLLREGTSIRNLTAILEALADAAPQTKDLDVLTERARAALAREISRELGEGRVGVLTLDPALEAALAEMGPSGTGPGLDGATLRGLRRSLERALVSLAPRGRPPVVLTTPAARLPFRRVTERMFPQLKVVSTSELVGDLQVESIGQISA